MIEDKLEAVVLEINSTFEKNLMPMLNAWSQPSILEQIWSEKQMHYLMKKRSFFHFIAIESPTRQRFANFKQKYAINTGLDLDLFLLIDDTVSSCSCAFLVCEHSFLPFQVTRKLNLNSMIHDSKVLLKNNGSIDDLKEFITSKKAKE